MNHAIYFHKLIPEQQVEIHEQLSKQGHNFHTLLKKKIVAQNYDDISDQLWDEVHTLGLTVYLEKWFDFPLYVKDQLETRFNKVELDGDVYYWEDKV